MQHRPQHWQRWVACSLFLSGILVLTLGTPIVVQIALVLSRMSTPLDGALVRGTTLPKRLTDPLPPYCQIAQMSQEIAGTAPQTDAYTTYQAQLMQHGWQPMGGHESSFTFTRGSHEWAEVRAVPTVDDDNSYDAGESTPDRSSTPTVHIAHAVLLPSLYLCSQ